MLGFGATYIFTRYTRVNTRFLERVARINVKSHQNWHHSLSPDIYNKLLLIDYKNNNDVNRFIPITLNIFALSSGVFKSMYAWLICEQSCSSQCKWNSNEQFFLQFLYKNRSIIIANDLYTSEWDNYGQNSHSYPIVQNKGQKDQKICGVFFNFLASLEFTFLIISKSSIFLVFRKHLHL